MKRLLKYILFAAIIAAGVCSCYYDSEEGLYPSISSTCDTTNVTYTLKIAPVFTANCLSCHSNSTYISNGGGVVKLQYYVDVKANLNQAYSDILIGKMPKGGAKLDDCTISLLTIWKNAGAPNN